MLPMTWTLLKMIWQIHRHARPHLLALIDSVRADKQVFHLQSPHDMRHFLAMYSAADS